MREMIGRRVMLVLWEDGAGCMGLCSDRCKLYEVVGPYGKCEDRVYRGCEKRMGRRVMGVVRV